MTKDEIIALAKEAGIQEPYTAGIYRANEYDLVKFAKSIQTKERERCAKLVEVDLYPAPGLSPYKAQYNDGIARLAARIRTMQ